MEHIIEAAELPDDKIDPEEEQTKRRILEKVARRMTELRKQKSEDCCAELNPDVIVIPADQSFLFEPQNSKAVEWLRRHFEMDSLGIREPIRIHPSQRERVVEKMTLAGFDVR